MLGASKVLFSFCSAAKRHQKHNKRDESICAFWLNHVDSADLNEIRSSTTAPERREGPLMKKGLLVPQALL